MKNLKVWQKLLLLGAVFLLPLIAVTYRMISSVHRLGISTAETELLGVEYSEPLLDLLRHLQEHRGLSAGVAGGGADALWQEFQAKTAQIERDLDRVGEVDQRLAATLGLGGRWPNLRQRCSDLAARRLQQPIADTTEYNQPIDELLRFLITVADHSKLTLDPEMETYYLMDLSIAKLPRFAEGMARAWAAAAGIPTGQPLGAERLSAIREQDALTQFLRDAGNDALAKASAADPTIAAHIAKPPPQQSLRDLWNEVLEAGTVEMLPAPFYKAMSLQLAPAYDLAKQACTALRALLEKRIERHRHNIRVSLGIGALGLLLVAGVAIIIMRDISRPLNELVGTSRAIAGGQLDAPVTVGERQDEIGELAAAFREMRDTERASREKLEAKTAEAERFAVEAQAANVAKRDFLALISHEIRTPMNGILGMTELALNTTLTASQRDYLMTVKSSAESLLTLLNDLLDFSKIEAGKLDLERVRFELRDMLGDTMHTLAARAHAAGLELALHVRPDVPDRLVGDPHRLRQIIVNLVGNALKFTHEGEVTVHVENAGAVQTPSDPHASSTGDALLRFSVADTGVGIRPEAREKIFSAFEQADSSTTRRYGGTGLGLSITSRLVALMHGAIELQSEVGRGSTFSFTARFGLARGPLGRAALPELEGLRVLAVDDNATNRFILKELFTSWRMDTVVAEDAASALVALESAQREGNPIALLVTDVMMPDIDGFGLIEQMKANSALRETHVIVLTSSGRIEDVQRCEELGVEAHLSKPVKHSMLLDKVLEAIGSRPRTRVAATSAEIPCQRPLHILLAEDNAVNQRVAVATLEAWGHHVVVTNDGAEAVDAWARDKFDVVLMDSQMPRMGGFEATAAIRLRERENGGHVPIIAMTANVMKGFAEECLAAGMDGFVAKPIRREELVNALAQAVPDLLTGGFIAPPQVATSNKADARPFDPSALLANAGGDRGLVREMVGLCCDIDGPRLLAELTAALDGRDFHAIERAAHALKGLVGEFHAPAAYDAARTLEQAAYDKSEAALADLAPKLRAEFDRLTAALEKFVQAPASS